MQGEEGTSITSPHMVDLDHTRTIDLESLKVQYADKFDLYTPKAGRSPTTFDIPLANADGHTPPRKYKLQIYPPLLNSSCPWATDLPQIQALYDTPYTGAVTTRTSLLEGFNHDPTIHQHTFFPVGSSGTAVRTPAKSDGDTVLTTATDNAHANVNDNPTFSGTPTGFPANATSSLNTYGYSPHTLSEYLGLINNTIGQRHLGTSTLFKKPFIISVTGTPDEIALSYALLANASEMDEDLRLCMEINLSCPNISNKPPPAYDEQMLTEYLEAVADSKATYRGRMGSESVPRVGLKLPPYTWRGQFEMVVRCLVAARSSEPDEGSVIDFVTCTNTLGSCLVLDEDGEAALGSEAGTGVGGLAGAALHPLALGNVATLRRLLDEHEKTVNIMIIGVGGVHDKAGFERMRKVGAEAVACATALGQHGVGIFEKITKGE